MRVSYLLNGLGKTGGNIVLYNFMDNLANRGYEVYAITPTRPLKWQAGIWRELINHRDVGWTVAKRLAKPIMRALGRWGFQGDLTIYITLARMINGLVKNWIESEVTIATYCFTAYAAYLLANTTRAFYHMQHYEELFFDDDLGKMLCRITYLLPIELISNSSWLREKVLNLHGRNSSVLYPGIDLAIFKPRTLPRQKYFPSKKKFIILSYADKRKWKGFEDALEAMRAIYKQFGHDRIEWWLFGLEVPRVTVTDVPFRYVGRVFGTKLAELYSKADLLLFPSWYESFPLQPLEAMACGTVVVVTRYGTEDYAEDGYNSIVVMPHDINALAQAIISILSNPTLARDLAERGLETAQRFTWQNATDRLEAILVGHSAQAM
jgi:glycosyltransferase involved in cell wall biosynthesis